MRVSPEEVAAHLRAQDGARDAAGRARATALRERLDDATALLRAAGARRIWLFGSLARGAEPGARPDSDVDLAALGLPEQRYFDLLASLMALFGTNVDLVRMEAAPPSLVERIREVGEEL